MAPFVLLNSKLWVDGFAMAGYKNRIALSDAIALKDRTVFGHSARARAAGLRETTVRSAGFWESTGTTQEPDKPHFDRIGLVDTVVSAAPEDGDEGDTAFLCRVSEARYELGAPVGEMLAYTVEAMGSDGAGLVRGAILANKDLAAGSSNGTAFQVGAIAAGKRLYAALHVLQIGTSLDVTIQSDDSGGMGSPTTRITFTQATAIGSQWQELAGPITDDFWRITRTSVGAPNAKFIVVIGIR